MSEITEAKLYEAFGLSPTEQGEQVQDPAEPAAEMQTDHNGTDQMQTDNAEPAEVGERADPGENAKPSVDSVDPEEEDHDADKDTVAGKQPLTHEQRRTNAARRRAQEQQAAVDAAVQAEQEKTKQMVEQVLSMAGLKNPTTGAPITTLEDFQKWGKETADAKLQQDLRAGKLTRETLDQLISAHPAVQQAQEQQARQRAEAERVRIEGQLAKIAELNPAIKGLGDILAMDTAAAFRENVAKGMDFYDAYRLANMDALAQDKARRAVAASQNNARGKEHLRATGNARGSGAASVPHDQMKLYRMMNPNMTDAQIQAHYNAYIKRGG